MRPANIITAWADILCGFTATQLVYIGFVQGSVGFRFHNSAELLWLILSTTGLYGGGVVFNDVFDYELDKIERPERPLPSSRASLRGAILLGMFLLAVAITSAFQVSPVSGLIAIAIAFAAVIYDKFSKHNPIIGPLNMGLCRGLNLILGMSIALEALYYNWFLSLIPIVFISAITMISRSEVRGGDRKTIALGGILFLFVIIFIGSLSFLTEHVFIYSIPFLLMFAYMVFKPLLKAFKDPSPSNIKKSVRGGILGLIPMNASIAAGFAGWPYGLLVILLLPISIYLAKKFAVT